jgi:hypothetical protein
MAIEVNELIRLFEAIGTTPIDEIIRRIERNKPCLECDGTGRTSLGGECLRCSSTGSRP